MTPLEAIRSATLHGATYLGMDKDLGSLEVGKLADLMVMNDNPLDDIQSSQDILYVMKNGRLYDAETMNEIGNILHVQAASIYKPRPHHTARGQGNACACLAMLRLDCPTPRALRYGLSRLITGYEADNERPAASVLHSQNSPAKSQAAV